jgi:hypothetical protein
VNPGCEPLCEKLVEADCDNGPTMKGCLLTCKVLSSSEVCDEDAQAYFDCVEGSPISCNGAGEPMADGCGLEWLMAIGCAISQDPNPEIVEPCADYCGHVVDTGCPNNGTQDECNLSCQWAGATGTGCADEWAVYLDCANAAQWSCVLGYALAQGCGGEYTDYAQCINQAGG